MRFGTDAKPAAVNPNIAACRTRRAMQSGRQTRATDFPTFFFNFFTFELLREADHRGGHSEPFRTWHQSRDAMSSKAEAGSGQSGPRVVLYPMVIINISDQFTRRAIQEKEEKAVGILLGTMEGSVLHVRDCLEIGFAQETTGAIKLEFEGFATDYKLHKEAYPANKMVGWFCTGAALDESQREIHAQVARHLGGMGPESSLVSSDARVPLLVLMNPSAQWTDGSLPISAFEGEALRECKYNISTAPSETVAICHVQQAGVKEKKGSQLAHQFESLQEGVGMLLKRLRALREYVVACRAGTARRDQALLRQIKGICNRLPTTATPDFKAEFQSEFNDALLVTYLSGLTQGTGAVKEAMSKFNTIQSEGSRGVSRKGLSGRSGFGKKGGLISRGMFA